MSVNAKIYKEQGASSLVIKAGDGAVVKGQAAANGTPAQAAHITDAATSGSATAADCATKINLILTALENVGIVAAS